MVISRLQLFGLTVTALSAAVITNAVMQRHGNFFAVCVQLTQYTGTLLTLCCMGLFLAIMMGQVLQRICFGNLRAAEVEHLYEKSWFSVMDACLAMTLFRDDFNIRFFMLFSLLLFIKSFHWIISDRVDFMDQTPNTSLIFHIRTSVLLAVLGLVDTGMLLHASQSILKWTGPSMMVIFAFEYAVLVTLVISTFLKYVLHAIDTPIHPNPIDTTNPAINNPLTSTWDQKSLYFLYIDLILDFTKLVFYLIFFGTIIQYIGLPIHVLRDLYITLRGFIQKCRDIIQYHRATRNMVTRYLTPTEDELGATDRVCIVCREEMIVDEITNPPQLQPPQPVPINANGNNNNNGFIAQLRDIITSLTFRHPPIHPMLPKKLPCGHMFHVRCLRSWLERQQSCPTCRRSVFDVPVNGVQPHANDAGNNNGNGGGAGQARPIDPMFAAAAAARNNMQQYAGAQADPQQQPQPLLQDEIQRQILHALRTMSQQQPHLPPVPGTSIPTTFTQQNTTETVPNLPVFLTPIGQIPPGISFSTLPSSVTIPSSTPLPVPISNTHLDHLSDIQLRQMEGTSRRAILYRIQALQHVQMELTGIVTQLTQILQMMPESTTDTMTDSVMDDQPSE